MLVHFTFRHMEPTDALKQHLESKIDKVTKYIKKLTHADLVLTVEKFRHIVEVTIFGPKVSFFVKEQDKDLYTAIDLAVRRMDLQLRKFKSRVKGHKFYYKTKRARLAAAHTLFDVDRLTRERQA